MVVQGSIPCGPIEVQNNQNMVEVEMTRVDCHSCQSAVMINGKDGTSVGYLTHCPFCGSQQVEREDKIWTPSNEVTLYPKYGEF